MPACAEGAETTPWRSTSTFRAPALPAPRSKQW